MMILVYRVDDGIPWYQCYDMTHLLLDISQGEYLGDKPFILRSNASLIGSEELISGLNN